MNKARRLIRLCEAFEGTRAWVINTKNGKVGAVPQGIDHTRWITQPENAKKIGVDLDNYDLNKVGNYGVEEVFPDLVFVRDWGVGKGETLSILNGDFSNLKRSWKKIHRILLEELDIRWRQLKSVSVVFDPRHYRVFSVKDFFLLENI